MVRYSQAVYELPGSLLILKLPEQVGRLPLVIDNGSHPTLVPIPTLDDIRFNVSALAHSKEDNRPLLGHVA